MPPEKPDKLNIDELLKLMVDAKASDLHIKTPTVPVIRVDGRLIRQEQFKSVTPEDVVEIYNYITSDHQKEVFAQEYELDFIYSIPSLARFRVNVLRQRGT